VKPIQYAVYTTTAANTGGGLVFALLAHFGIYPLMVQPVVMDAQSQWHYAMLWWFVAILGLGYGVAAKDPSRQTAMILVGGLGKLTAALIWAYIGWIGVGSLLVLPAAVFDGALGIWFLVFIGQEMQTKPAGNFR